MKYDYFVSGRWRNHKQVELVAKSLRQAGKKVYCFIENEYQGDGIKIATKPGAGVGAMMSSTEQLKDWQTNPTFRSIFARDMQAQRDSEALVSVFPIGYSGHVELGVAYGLGQKCYGIGQPEKAETLYFVFDQIFPTIEDFVSAISQKQVVK